MVRGEIVFISICTTQSLSSTKSLKRINKYQIVEEILAY